LQAIFVACIKALPPLQDEVFAMFGKAGS